MADVHQYESYKVIGWARSTRGHRNLSQKAILIILADYYNPAFGYAWPTTQTLADDAEIDVRSILRHLHNLEQAGFITINHNSTGDRRRRNTYSFNFHQVWALPDSKLDSDDGDNLSPVTDDQCPDPTGDIDGPEQVTPVATTGDTGASVTNIEPIREPRGDPAPSSSDDDKDATPSRQESTWEPPDFFKPLTTLPGYVKRNYTRTVTTIEAVCQENGVDPARVVSEFADYFRGFRYRHGWKDPVRSLANTLPVQVSKVLKADQRRRERDPSGYVRDRDNPTERQFKFESGL